MTQIQRNDIDRWLDKAVFVNSEKTKAALLKISNEVILNGTGSTDAFHQLIRQGEFLTKQELKALGLNLFLKFGKDALQYFQPAGLKHAVEATRKLFHTVLQQAVLAADVEEAIESQELVPIVGMKWYLSSRSDPYCPICKAMAMNDKYGIGPGVFPLLSPPSIPHLDCGCYWSIKIESMLDT